MQPLKSLVSLVMNSLQVVSCLGYAPRSVGAQSPTEIRQSGGPSAVIFHFSYGTRTDPVKITHFFLGDKEVPLDTPVTVDGMWLRNIRVVVQNITSRTISRIEVDIDFPETGGGNKPMETLRLAMGRFPKHSFMQKDGGERSVSDQSQPPEISIPPCSEVTLAANPLADVDQNAVYKAAAHISKAQLSFPPVHFSDESKWQAGSFYVAVPPPAVWQQAPATEFLNQTCPALP